MLTDRMILVDFFSQKSYFSFRMKFHVQSSETSRNLDMLCFLNNLLRGILRLPGPAGCAAKQPAQPGLANPATSPGALEAVLAVLKDRRGCLGGSERSSKQFSCFRRIPEAVWAVLKGPARCFGWSAGPVDAVLVVLKGLDAVFLVLKDHRCCLDGSEGPCTLLWMFWRARASCFGGSDRPSRLSWWPSAVRSHRRVCSAVGLFRFPR